MGMWYNDNPNCGRCGHLNHMGFCNLTACMFPVAEAIPSNRVVTSEPTPVRDTMVGGLPDANKLGTWQEGIVKEYRPQTAPPLCDECANWPCTDNKVTLQKYCPAFCSKEKPQTNADRIRAMSDEELAEYLANMCGCPPGAEEYLCSIEPSECAKCWLTWLREEAEP